MFQVVWVVAIGIVALLILSSLTFSGRRSLRGRSRSRNCSIGCFIVVVDGGGGPGVGTLALVAIAVVSSGDLRVRRHQR